MRNLTILAVDDVEANRVSLQYLLDEYLENTDLILATCGEEALKITYTQNIDIIILDIQMPGMDGFETAKYLKSNPKTKDIPIIFLTAAFKEEEFQQKGFQIGAIDYLTKPIDNHQLINKIRLYKEVIIKTKELEAVNDSLYGALQKEIELKEKIQKQQLELIEQSKMAALGEMISNIAHQWRQPLSIISTCASGLEIQKEMGILNDHDFKTNVDSIITTTKELSKTIETFRDFTYQDTIIEFSLSELIHKCLHTQQRVFEELNIEVITELNDDIELKNLPNSLRQSIVNILQNAREALVKIKEERLIFIQTQWDEEKEEVQIHIKDSAGGIKTNHLNKVFEPYFTTKHKAHGIGLGLNVTYNIITENMYGTLKVKNNRYEYNDQTLEGAQFTITLPLNRA
jgi:C4-dicarboxylate-specific signal transduction histidine kinase